MKQNNMLAMILAGGRGSRLHDLTNKVAKPAVSTPGRSGRPVNKSRELTK